MYEMCCTCVSQAISNAYATQILHLPFIIALNSLCFVFYKTNSCHVQRYCFSVVIVLIFFLYNSLTTENQTAESWFKTIAMDDAAIVHRPISPYISRVNFCAFKDSYSKITRFCSGIFSSGILDFFSEACKVHFGIYSFNILGSMLGLLL